MARWTDLAPRQEHTQNQNAGGMVEFRGLVVHIASGFYLGTIAYQKNASSQVSSHFIVDRDGTLCQMVDTADRAWTQRAGNGHWLSIECAGFTPDDPLHASHPGWERLTDQQIAAIARVLARAHTVYGIPLQLATDPTGRGLGHHSMGGTGCTRWDWGHCGCPGAAIIGQKQAIIDRAQQIIGGDDVNAAQDAALTHINNQVSAMFPELRATLAGLTAQAKATAAAVQALAAGGTSVDTAAVINHIDQVAAAESQAVAGLHDELAAAQAEIADLKARLVAAGQAWDKP